MYIKLKKEADINHNRTQDYLKKCIGAENPVKFDWDKEYLIYRMILASFSNGLRSENNSNRLKVNDDIDLVNFYIFDKEIDLLNNSGMDALIDALNSDNKNDMLKNLSARLNENFNWYSDEEKREEFMVRFLIKLFADDNSLELDNFDTLENLAVLNINGVSTNAIPGLKRISRWI